MPGAHRKKKSKKPNAARLGGGAHDGRELIFKDDSQMYAIVQKAVGDRRFVVKCDDNKERVCKLRGSMKRSEWVCVNDILLLSSRGELNETKADVLLRYTPHDVKLLKKYGELDFLETTSNAADALEDNEDFVCFENV